MSSSNRSNAILPDGLRHVLEMRKSTGKCRGDVEAALVKYGLVLRGPSPAVGASVAQASPGAGRTSMRSSPSQHQSQHQQQHQQQQQHQPQQSRFMNLGHCAAPEGWRSKAPVEEDKWVSVSKRRGGGGGSGSGGGSGGSGSGSGNGSNNNGMYGFRRNPDHHSSTASTIPSATAATAATATTATAWRSSRFQPLEETISNESMEDRIMLKVRGKVNKLGHSTYDATKAFMKQILDSGETDFLEEFMRFVFGKSATETPFCSLYARFLHELADEFPHLREVMVRKFREYTRVFDDASRAPDVGTSDYVAFVEAQEQKKFRRGYSQFVAELAKLGEVSMEDFRLLVGQIVGTIEATYVKEDNRLMCEEVIDCFRTMVQAVKVEWMKEYESSLRSIASAPRESSPGLTNKGRFAIMDILDLVAGKRR